MSTCVAPGPLGDVPILRKEQNLLGIMPFSSKKTCRDAAVMPAMLRDAGCTCEEKHR